MNGFSLGGGPKRLWPKGGMLELHHQAPSMSPVDSSQKIPVADHGISQAIVIQDPIPTW